MDLVHGTHSGEHADDASGEVVRRKDREQRLEQEKRNVCCRLQGAPHKADGCQMGVPGPQHVVPVGHPRTASRGRI